MSGLEHRSVNPVREVADDPVAFGRLADQLFGREARPVLAQDNLVARVEQGICPAFRQGAGNEDARHLVGRVVDGAGTLDADCEAEAVDRSVVADRAQRVHLVWRDVHQIAL